MKWSVNSKISQAGMATAEMLRSTYGYRRSPSHRSDHAGHGQ
jgi:hypothetical protein